jgi:malonate transporter and related proteins
MTAIFLVLLPVFLVIAGGLGLRWSGLIGAEHWPAIDRLCYFVLFPCFFFKEIAAADFSSVPVIKIAGAMVFAILAMSAVLLVLNRPLKTALRLDGPQFSSLFQGVVRWHTFIAFAVTPLYFGKQLLGLAALAAAVMTPVLNVICVAVIAQFAASGPVAFRGTLAAIARNPFLLSSLAGAAWNAAGLPLPEAVFQVLDMVSKGALGLALLSVGAGLRLEHFATHARPIVVGTALKLFAMPCLVWLMLHLMGVDGPAAAVAILCNAVPTGSGSYVLARQLGGDAPLVANILTAQVIAAAASIPIVLMLLS